VIWTRPKNETLRTCIGRQEYALLYGSYDKKRHIAPFKPYYVGGNLCNESVGHLTGTGDLDNLCQVCLDEFNLLKNKKCK